MERNELKCSCGTRIILDRDEDPSREKRCHVCGKVINVADEDTEAAAPDSDVTERVNLTEMARLAQDGVDLVVSGEWVTPLKGKTRPSKKKKK